MCFHTELKQTILWYVKVMGVRRGVKTGANPGGAIAPPKTCELTLFTMIAYDSENSIRIFAIQGYCVFHYFVTEVLGSILHLS